MIGKCYHKLHQEALALEYFKKTRDCVRGVPFPSQDDRESLVEAEQFLKSVPN